MDRKEFSNMLVEARKDAGKSQMDVVFALGKESFSFVQRIEKSGSNYKVKFAQEYAASIGCVILLQKDKANFILETKDDIVNWILTCVKECGGQSKLAEEIQSNRALLNPTNLQKTDISIDSFLSIANACGYEVKIQKSNHVPLIKTDCDSELIPIMSGLSVLGYAVYIYKSGSRYSKISDKGDVSLFLNQCIKLYGGKEKMATDLELTLQKINDIISAKHIAINDFKNIATKCGYEIKIEKL